MGSKFFFSGQAKEYNVNEHDDDDDDDMNDVQHIKINSSDEQNLWTSTDIKTQFIRQQDAEFNRHIIGGVDALHNVENDILNEMMYRRPPSMQSMNAPHPMLNEEYAAEQDDDDEEKDILLGLTPGGPNDATTPGNEQEFDEWSDWQPQSEQEKDLQFEIAAALIDGSGGQIEMNQAMKEALLLMIQMKKNNEPLTVPSNLSSQQQIIGPSAKQQKNENDQNEEEEENDFNRNEIANAMKEIEQIFDNKSEQQIVIKMNDESQSRSAVENEEQKLKMSRMEEMAYQIREIELSRRRLLFSEYPFSTNCLYF